ncbi:flavin monoamine oxidase family protein [Myroides marinus]|uniref:flavin monoamine oxidase family protein n=1 Tax=Myroides marinus TaxID=703342 RepID=UPI0025789A79|nr:NAD(P)/FAD-dependent oxidoreductase [Myroides marinus]MDM1368108.1 FAD-dependent oxidoreductase [Myroides marinus]MDM1373025.1 FAD-dependent oxidoreductase [Myroides marinus]MDM1381205.1 FAD-dependent oxidoreductase [Myroides marinus]
MEKIAIIGAGVSGLTIGKLLLEKGCDVTIFEARKQIGGRLKEAFVNGYAIDLGGQWLHQIDDRKNSLTDLINTTGEVFQLDEYKEVICDRRHDYYADVPEIFERFLNYMETLGLKEDETVFDSLRKFTDDPFMYSYIEAFLADMAAGSRNYSSKKFKENLATFKPTDYALRDKTMANTVLEYYNNILQNYIKVNTPVKTISYINDDVRISTLKGEEYSFSKCIISVPISQLKTDKINFVPVLPSEKREAFHKIGFGKGVKVLLFFSNNILDKSYFNLEYAPYYIQKTLKGKEPIYVIYTLLFGDYAERYYHNPENIKGNIFKELSALSNSNIKVSLIEAVYQDWSGEEYIEGTYSFPLPNEDNARAIAAEPIDNKLFFIGEAMNLNSEYGFIHGAMDTAISLAKKF